MAPGRRPAFREPKALPPPSCRRYGACPAAKAVHACSELTPQLTRFAGENEPAREPPLGSETAGDGEEGLLTFVGRAALDLDELLLARPARGFPARGEKGDGVGEIRSEERRVGKECRSRWSPYH